MTAQVLRPTTGSSDFTEIGMPSATAMPKAPSAAHSKKRACKERKASTDGEGGATWSHQWDASEQWATDSREDDTWGTWGSGAKHGSAPKAKAKHQDDKATDVPQDATEQPTASDDEGSELELVATTFSVKKKVFRAVTAVIQWGYALDHRRSTIGLAQISPAKALAILGNIHTVGSDDSQQYVDRCIEEAIATHGSTQPQALPRPSYAKHIHWTAQLISRQLVNFVRYPTTRPMGLHVYKYDMLRIEDVMTWWGTREGLTTTEVIEAVKEHSMDRTMKRFSLVSEPHRTMLIVHKNTPVGQATHRAFSLKTKLRKNSQGKKKKYWNI